VVGAQGVTSAVGPPVGRASVLPAPTPTIRRAAFQKEDPPDGKKENKEKQQSGGTVQFPPTRESPRSISGIRVKSGDDVDYVPQTDMPGIDRLTRRESEQQFYERIRQESRRYPASTRIYFPDEEPVLKETFTARHFPHMVQTVAPSFVCHGRLYFEQPNFERHGWSLGAFTPAANLAVFYYDVALLPYHYWTDPCSRYDCSSGKSLPGDPTPFLLYREKLSVTGLAGQFGAVAGGFFVLP
jgi:hypothetical protein